MDSPVSAKDEMWFLLVCHHISNAVYQNRLSYFMSTKTNDASTPCLRLFKGSLINLIPLRIFLAVGLKMVASFEVETCDDTEDKIICFINYEGWNFNSDNYLFTTDTK